MTDKDLWWRPKAAEPGERHKLVAKAIRELDERQYGSRNRDLEHGHAYDSTTTLMGTEMMLETSLDEPPIENLICTGVDTMSAHLARDRPRLAVMTEGADWETQEYAQGVEKVLAAEVRRLKIYPTRHVQMRDAGVFGAGIVKIYEDTDTHQPAIDRVLKDELVVDEEEGRAYMPRTIYQRRFVDRWQLIHRFPDFREQIENANGDGRWCSYRKMGRHQVALLEGWHLRSGKGATDGWRIMCIEGADLVFTEWERDYYPFLIWDWSPRLTGFWGRGLAEQGVPVQARVNRHDRFVAVAQDRIAVPTIYVQKGSGVKEQIADNRAFKIVEVPGRPPVVDTPMAVSPEIYNDRREKRSMFFEANGISQLAASAKLPANFQGGDSQPALREYREQSTERHAPQDQSSEDLLLEYGDRILDVIEEIAARNDGSYRTTYISEEAREEIDWKDVKIARDRFSLILQPANGLSRTLAGRRQEVEEDYAAGTISRDEYRKLRGYPDINAERALEGAVTELSDAIMSGLIKGRPMSEIGPEYSDDLEYITRRVNLKRSYLKAHRATPSMLERFDTWLEQAQFLIDQGKAGGRPPSAPMAAPPPSQALPGAQPGPQLVPNAAPAAQQQPAMPAAS